MINIIGLFHQLKFGLIKWNTVLQMKQDMNLTGTNNRLSNTNVILHKLFLSKLATFTDAVNTKRKPPRC